MMIISILTTSKLRHRGIKRLAKGHTATKWQNQDLNEGGVCQPYLSFANEAHETAQRWDLKSCCLEKKIKICLTILFHCQIFFFFNYQAKSW